MPAQILQPARRWHWLTIAGLLAAMAIEIFGLGLLDTTEARLADAYLRRHQASYQPDADIVVIDIDDRSMVAMQDIAGLWAWPREIHADLIDALMAFAPRAVAIDIVFSDRDRMRPNSDMRLADSVKAAPNVYLSAVQLPLAHDGAGVPLATLQAAFDIKHGGAPDAVAALQLPQVVASQDWRLGLVNSKKDDDGVLRRYPLYAQVGGWQLPSLPARLASASGAALPAGADFILRWAAGAHKHYSYGDLYRLLTEGRMTPDELRTLDALLRDKIILIGSSATGSFDHHVTPIGPNTPGIDILATAIDNLKNRRSVTPVPQAVPFALGAAFIGLLAWAFARRINPAVIGAGLLAASLASVAAADAAIARNWLMPVATPIAFAWAWFLLAAIGAYLRERRTREQAVSLFGRFLNPNVVQRIVEQGETVESLSGKTSQVTVLFSDIRGFTTLSETREPHEVVTLLNRYFERQVEVVFKHGGTLDKFIGDCIMAFWGAPVPDAEHAERAVAAALEMQEVLLAFKRELAAEGAEVGEFDVGIGVHSGPAVVGFIGAQRKLDYTAIGDTVNLASRVEGLTKGVARVLVTRDTMQACRSGAIRFVARGAFAVKGRAAEVELYEPERTSA